MRRQHDIVERRQCRMQRRFVFEHVEAGGGQASAGQRRDQRGVIDDAAAGDVDQDRRWFHQRQLGCSDRVAVFRRERQHEHEKIGAAEQFVPWHISRAALPFDALVEARAVVIEHGHRESGSAACDRLADAAHAEDAERAAMDFLAEQQAIRRSLPAPGAKITLAFADAPRSRQQQRPGEIGDGLVEDVGRVRRNDAGGRKRRDVEIVVAHTGVRDRAQAWRLPDRFGIDRIRHAKHGAILVAQLRTGLGRGPRAVVHLGFHIEVVAQTIDDVVEQRARNPYPRAFRFSHFTLTSRRSRFPECAGRSRRHRRIARDGAAPDPSGSARSSLRRSASRGCRHTDRDGPW